MSEFQDIVFADKSADYFKLTDIVFFDKTNCFYSSLTVESNGFRATNLMCDGDNMIHEANLIIPLQDIKTIICELEVMDTALRGECTIKSVDREANIIRMVMTENGRMRISGQVLLRNGVTNILQFSFFNDQTSLRPFISRLKMLLAAVSH